MWRRDGRLSERVKPERDRRSTTTVVYLPSTAQGFGGWLCRGFFQRPFYLVRFCCCSRQQPCRLVQTPLFIRRCFTQPLARRSALCSTSPNNSWRLRAPFLATRRFP